MLKIAYNSLKSRGKVTDVEIRLENLTKSFGDLVAVDNLSLLLREGKLISFLGPSGCGKSTTLNMIAGIIDQTSGSIYFNDIKVDKIPTQKRNIGMIFQNYALYPHMTVFENIAFPLQIQNKSKADIKSKVNEVVNMLQIDDLLKKQPGQISGGQQQRVAIARALVKKPDALLMDEPFSNLDKKLRVETREEVRRLQKNLGISTIFVTHDQEEASSISDYILLMDRGKQIQFGTPSELYYDPTHLFTAQFIGEAKINEFDGKYENGNITILKDIMLKFIPEEECPEEIIVAIRPENFKPSYHPAIIVSKVIGSEMLGKDKLITSKANEEEINWFISSDSETKNDEVIKLGIDVDKVLVFNRTTKRRIRGKVIPSER